jgi:hypothetical protein
MIFIYNFFKFILFLYKLLKKSYVIIVFNILVIQKYYNQKKEIKFNFTTPKKDWSIYGGWVNRFEPINKGRLGSTQKWRIEKPKRHYY